VDTLPGNRKSPPHNVNGGPSVGGIRGPTAGHTKNLPLLSLEPRSV